MEEKADGLGHYNRVALVLASVFLLVTSFFLKESNFMDMGNTGFLSLAAGLAMDILLLVSVYITSEPLVPHHQDRLVAVTLSAAVLFACPGAVVASVIHPASIALLWAQFCLLKEEYFIAFFLMGISAMFFPPVLWIAALVVILMLAAGLSDPLRNLLKFLGGLLVPYMLTLGAAYVAGFDVTGWIAEFWSKMTTISTGFLSLEIPILFLVVCITFMCIHASVLFLGRMSECGIAESYALKVQIINVVVSAAVFFLFASSSGAPVALLACCPVAVLLARYFAGYGRSSFLRIEIVILLCALVISRLGNFIV